MEPLKGMKCHRCGGAMVYERFYSEDDRFEGWRCIICGEIVDQVILESAMGQNWRDESVPLGSQ